MVVFETRAVERSHDAVVEVDEGIPSERSKALMRLRRVVVR
jgi:hypothetical protein